MPTISAPAKVLLTGGSGFLAVHILQSLLTSGYTVVTTVRSPQKAEHLKTLFAEYKNSGKLDFAFVADVAKEDAFDDVIKHHQDLQGVIHSASPLGRPGLKLQDFLDGAINGTTGILKSIGKYGSGIKRVVVTSSVAAVREPKPDGYQYTEEDWNVTLPEKAKELGDNSPSFLSYIASKSLAEKAAWDWVAENKPSFDLVSILPSFLWGPVIHEQKSPVDGSNGMLLQHLKAEALADKATFSTAEEFVDVRDSAIQHVRALEIEAAGGERILSTAYSVVVQDILDILNAHPVDGITVPKGNPEAEKKYPILYSPEKAVKILGVKYRPAEETIVDTVKSGLQYGWSQ